jgi:hypothetical protein
MKKGLVLLAFPILVKAGEIDQMWNYLYNHIAGCINDEIYSTTKTPIHPLKSKHDLLDYLKSLDLPPGYYVIVNTRWITSPQVCYIRWRMRQLGYNSRFYAPANILIVAIVKREADAIDLTNKLKTFVNPKYVFYVPVFPED